jgi:hypothetical protein
MHGQAVGKKGGTIMHGKGQWYFDTFGCIDWHRPEIKGGAATRRRKLKATNGLLSNRDTGWPTGIVITKGAIRYPK